MQGLQPTAGDHVAHGTYNNRSFLVACSIADKIAKINSSMDEAVAAQEAGDYKAALRKTEVAYLLIVGLPKRSQLEHEELEWGADGISKALEYLRSRVTGATTIDTTDETLPGSIWRPVPVRYTREREASG